MMGPTGSGKGSLVRHIKEKFPDVKCAVSCTTREKRPHETHGVEYYFVSKEEFKQKIEHEEFLEWAEFSGNYYGTLKSEIVERLENNQVILNEIELQGVQQLLPLLDDSQRTVVYLEAGQWDVLEARAKARAPISEEHLALRHERYLEEIKMKPYADVVIDNTNGQLEQANRTIETLVQKIFDNIDA